ncbi:hypothetical protein EMIHUDRAFT_451583 [Emiliania huxleyi CCMP1516]|uniref:TIR domain-containing protein n=2 Tax=Emiliania huxleyi TaxID=2903 RepID=A0A0D3IXH9_EMIH1|nr:hypothetical protein EMIHUDRAFT_451583 [Emiliania huxleyi CCMP1516]EOD15964.1 hypothetical protein EMIHUDRAFT_451583 [Emiliania huxleyi CCMP1516]|eukprot:XP_005768393.1 hypothetical protein EMIHUDRAFT_451583 [Emiliania huxleyi CCMP1516]
MQATARQWLLFSPPPPQSWGFAASPPPPPAGIATLSAAAAEWGFGFGGAVRSPPPPSRSDPFATPSPPPRSWGFHGDRQQALRRAIAEACGVASDHVALVVQAAARRLSDAEEGLGEEGEEQEGLGGGAHPAGAAAQTARVRLRVDVRVPSGSTYKAVAAAFARSLGSADAASRLLGVAVVEISKPTTRRVEPSPPHAGTHGLGAPPPVALAASALLLLVALAALGRLAAGPRCAKARPRELSAALSRHSHEPRHASSQQSPRARGEVSGYLGPLQYGVGGAPLDGDSEDKDEDKDEAELELQSLTVSRLFGRPNSVEAAMEARFLQTELEVLLGRKCFLDSDDLRDLRLLQQAVRESEVLLLVQSESVLTRPYCLLEMVTAIEARVPIVGVNLAGKPQAYDFANAANYLSSLDKTLDASNPGAAGVLRRANVELRYAARLLSCTIPEVISISFNPSSSRNMLAASIADVAAAIEAAVPCQVPSASEWEKWELESAASSAARSTETPDMRRRMWPPSLWNGSASRLV